jgi:hypothetical protein
MKGWDCGVVKIIGPLHTPHSGLGKNHHQSSTVLMSDKANVVLRDEKYVKCVACKTKPWYCYCSRHCFMHIRGWMQMVLAPNDLFSWNKNTMSYILVMDMLHYCCSMHNDNYSVHYRSLKPWWSCLPCLQSFCYVFSPPLSGFNWRLTSPFGGQGPPTPKMASPLLGSPHTPFPGSGTATATCSLYVP